MPPRRVASHFAPVFISSASAGFSIVELVLFIGVVGLMGGAIVSFSILSDQVRVQNDIVAEVEQNAAAFLAAFTREVQNADLIVYPALDATDDAVLLATAVPKREVLIHLHDNRARIVENGTTVTFMTTEDMGIRNLSFLHFGEQDVREGVTVTFEAYNTAKGTSIAADQYSKNYWGTAAPRTSLCSVDDDCPGSDVCCSGVCSSSACGTCLTVADCTTNTPLCKVAGSGCDYDVPYCDAGVCKVNTIAGGCDSCAAACSNPVPVGQECVTVTNWLRSNPLDHTQGDPDFPYEDQLTLALTGPAAWDNGSVGSTPLTSYPCYPNPGYPCRDWSSWPGGGFYYRYNGEFALPGGVDPSTAIARLVSPYANFTTNYPPGLIGGVDMTARVNNATITRLLVDDATTGWFRDGQQYADYYTWRGGGAITPAPEAVNWATDGGFILDDGFQSGTNTLDMIIEFTDPSWNGMGKVCVAFSGCGDWLTDGPEIGGCEECDNGGLCSGGANDGLPCSTHNASVGCPGGTCIVYSGDGCSNTCECEECGDGYVCDSEDCDDGKHCADGTACTTDEDCEFDFTEPYLCIPRNGDGCSDTCNDEVLPSPNEECNFPIETSCQNSYKCIQEGNPGGCYEKSALNWCCPLLCGNGTCDTGENCSNCAADCNQACIDAGKTCRQGVCRPTCTDSPECDDLQYCTFDTCTSIPSDTCSNSSYNGSSQTEPCATDYPVFCSNPIDCTCNEFTNECDLCGNGGTPFGTQAECEADSKCNNTCFEVPMAFMWCCPP